MPNEKTYESNAQGEGVNTPVTEDKGGVSEYQKLKELNDAFEKELIRSKEMEAEAQKIEANKRLAGTSGEKVEPVVKEVSPEDYAKQVMAGEVPNGE